MRIASIIAALALATLATACANRTGDLTIAQWCAQDASRGNTDICKQHADTEEVRSSLGTRIAEVFGVANRAQATADQAMARNVVCVTRTMNRTRAGTCDPGYTLTGCTQTRYTSRAGGMAILRSVSDSECRFNGQVLEVQVRCCAMGPNPPPATLVRDTAPPAPETPQPAPVS
ncbi:hypothetical protein [Candidatus Viadribacter manganicus]|uniref:Lipoprotein n=1 Tax=Candidatus Viadribacter manganicus TaxID=1759059 RepID=A0A1B1AIN8_9PROT|nr:hypothetical protein [Candidatus Viadribacter manganicus]ANP46427.1 hypothetical protein ATE48_11115 [Candidatus Viadribacter manganicus]